MNEAAAAWGGPDPRTDLEKLAAELDSQAYSTCLVTPPGRRTRLQVTNRACTSMTEAIYSGDGYFWWGWAERIAPVWNIAEAAHAVAQVLNVAGRP